MHPEAINQQSENQRERLQSLFDKAFQCCDEALLRQQYKILRELEMGKSFTCNKDTTHISAVAEAVTIACDILTGETEVSFVFCGNTTGYAYCNQTHLIKALLNLLSNAYLYGDNGLVTVKAIEKADVIQLEVQSGGAFWGNAYGKGLKLVDKICKTSNGRFFIEQSLTHTRAVMLFNKSKEAVTTQPMDFYDLINDRLSPVYVEIFGMNYH